jgi:uncharacterized protein involved in response to NO
MSAPQPLPPVLTAGFRPFFLAASCWAVLALALWLAMLMGRIILPSRFDPLSWHVHEMLFGFVMAGVGGFLLTAIPNWTGRPPVRGTLLGVLIGLWALGRVATLVSALLPVWLAIAADLAFPVMLEIVAARELIMAGNRRNYPLMVPVAVLGLANLLMHLEAAGFDVPPGLGWRLGLAAVAMLIAVIGGRIVPAFTRNWLAARGAARLPPPAGRLDSVALGLLLAGLLAWAFLPDVDGVGWLLLAGAAVHLVRLARWQGLRTISEPVLAILHLGYFWLVLAVALLGVARLLPALPLAAALHALTAGAFSTMLLAVMTRATLGHTGRALHANGLTIAIYVLVTVGAVLRVLAAWPAAATMLLLGVAAFCWAAAFALFAVVYGRFLLTSRPGV